MTDQLPPQASRAGKNRYYHQCGPVGSQRHYGICLFTIEAHERGQALSETPCVEAIKAGTCPALKMRQEELDAGRALYFTPPDPAKALDVKTMKAERSRVDYNSASYHRGRYGEVWGGTESQTKAKAKSSAATSMPRKPSPAMVEFDASAIVNAAMNPRTLEEVQQEIARFQQRAVLRKRLAVKQGEKPKDSIVKYLTPDELRTLAKLKAEKDAHLKADVKQVA